MVLENNNQLTKLNSWINEDISSVISARQMGLYNLMSYHFGWTGKPGEDFIDTNINGLHNLRRYGLACLVTANSLDDTISKMKGQKVGFSSLKNELIKKAYQIEHKSGAFSNALALSQA